MYVAGGLNEAASHRKLLSQCAGRVVRAPVAMQTPKGLDGDDEDTIASCKGQPQPAARHCAKSWQLRSSDGAGGAGGGANERPWTIRGGAPGKRQPFKHETLGQPPARPSL